MSCADCRHFYPLGTSEIGQCRRYPPSIGKPQNYFASSYNATFPSVPSMWDCGEFAPLPHRRPTK